MSGFFEFLRSIGAARLGAMFSVVAALVGFFIFMILRLSEPQMTPLFTGLSIEDSNAIVQQLDGMNVKYKLRSNGTVVMASKDKALRLRMQLAADGLPTGGSIGYEIFDKANGLGTTSFVQNINHLRALEGELARTIRSLDRVKMARVHLVLPERQLFATGKTEPSASIVLRMRGGLGGSQVKAIRHLAAAAVQGLKPENVSIVDETGKLLASGASEGGATIAMSGIAEREAIIQGELKSKVEDIVASIVGADNTRVQVTAELDFKRVTQTSDIYDPDGQVVRSTRTKEEIAASQNKRNTGSMSAGNELPDAGNRGANGSTGSNENSNRTEETVNYEISLTKKTQIQEAGSIKRLSVAVLVDGVSTKNDKGEISYAPRPQEQLDQIAALVRSAIGFDKSRGDKVEVVNMRFAPGAKPEIIEPEPEPFLGLTKEDYFYIGQIFALFLFALLVLFFVIRPLVRRIVTPEQAMALGERQTGETVGLLPGPDGAVAAETGDLRSLPAPDMKNPVSDMIDIAKVSGDLQGNSVKKVGELVKNNPNEAVSIIRQWMSEPA